MSQANREILFRGRVLYNGNHRFAGEWVYGFYWTNYMGNNFIKICCDKDGFFVNEDVEVDPDTVGQYTNMKDKNGHKIFEGDIAECTGQLFSNWGKTPTGKYSTSRYAIVWSEGSWATEAIYSDRWTESWDNKGLKNHMIGKLCSEFYEVIGNTHEQSI